MTGLVPAFDGAARVYAVFGDPVVQVRTPALVNPLFAERCPGLVAVPFHVTPANLEAAWRAFAAMPNVAGIGVTVPHKIAAARLCDRLTPAAGEVGAVNAIQRAADGAMHGALFDGLGFVAGLGPGRARLRGASVLLAGAGGAGRAIAHALAGEPIARLAVTDIDADASAFAAAMANRVAGRAVARAGGGEMAQFDVVINATPIGVKASGALPFDPETIRPGALVADIAAMAGGGDLLRIARARGCPTSDGRDMLDAQIALIAGFASGLPAGTPL